MLTENQIESMLTLSNYVGKTIDVLTSEYTANINPDFARRAKGLHKGSTLRGLQSKGFIKIEETFWKGATVTILKGLNL